MKWQQKNGFNVMFENVELKRRYTENLQLKASLNAFKQIQIKFLNWIILNVN